jgi:hypothetical protein
VLLASGSVDQSNTYVFEVVPRGVKESASKNLSYWSTANGDDTMVTLWNAADEAQDFVFTIFFSGGHYLLPVHLDPRATHMFNVSEVIESQTPDSEGNVIPLSVQEGSAKLSGPHGENEHILVAMDAGTYNVRKATCAYRCINCNGAVSWAILANPFAVAMNGSTQLTFTSTWNTGNKYDRTRASTWGSSNTSVATVNTGLVNGIGVGNIIINGADLSEPWPGQVCGSPTPPCPPDQGIDGSAPGSTIPTVKITGASNFAFVGSDPTMPRVLQQAVGNPNGGTYGWTASPTNRISFDNASSDVVGMSGINPSTSVGDTTLTATYTLNNQSGQATLSATSRIFVYVTSSTVAVPLPSGTYGYEYNLTYDTFTCPGGQLLQPGYSLISVPETVSVTSTNMPGATTHTGTGGTNSNSEFVDTLALISNQPIPSNASEIDSQDIFVGGIFVRNNTLSYSATTVTVTNNGTFTCSH